MAESAAGSKNEKPLGTSGSEKGGVALIASHGNASGDLPVGASRRRVPHAHRAWIARAGSNDGAGQNFFFEEGLTSKSGK